MACRCQKILAPAMNTAMYENPVVQDNIRKLQTYGYEVITPASGYLACGDTGAGKMPEPETLLEYILRETAFQKDLAGTLLAWEALERDHTPFPEPLMRETMAHIQTPV